MQCHTSPALSYPYSVQHVSLFDLSRKKTVRRTTVIGIMGAFGNTKVTSSNLLRRRQFCARPTLYVVKSDRFLLFESSSRVGGSYQPAPLIRLSQYQLNKSAIEEDRTNLSPRPCAIMTVAVCFLIAGTTKGARYDILCYQVSSL